MTNANATQSIPRQSSGRLWFGTAGAVAFWFVIELVDVGVAWVACQQAMAGFVHHTGVRLVLGLLTLLSFALTVAAGLTSYANWRTHAEQTDFAATEAHGRREFMSFVGVLVSGTLGVGTVLFILPILVLGGCWGMY